MYKDVADACRALSHGVWKGPSPHVLCCPLLDVSVEEDYASGRAVGGVVC